MLSRNEAKSYWVYRPESCLLFSVFLSLLKMKGQQDKNTVISRKQWKDLPGGEDI